ncbi:MAG: choline dehydrogenase [Alphaproteobacteria bacterium]
MTGKVYDYVIAGGGSAGCVLAARLSEDPAVTVCLLEAGPPDRNPFIHVPATLFMMMRHKTLNWRFETAPQEKMSGASVYIPRGRVLGGSSSINGMVYIRGHRLDYDDWAAAGNTGWGWDDVLPWFRKSENNEQFGDDPLHGTGGPLNVTFVDSPSPLHENLCAAAEELQYRRTDNFNAAEQDGFGIHQVTQKNGRRWSTASAFLAPARKRPNLEIVTDARVARIAFDDKRASGVEFVRGGARETVSARREVVIAAGAIASPQILMLSGIGDGTALSGLGIPVVRNLPGVGRNLQDHIATRIEYDSPSALPYGISPRTLPRHAVQAVNYLLRRRGFWSSNLVEGGGFIRTRPGLDRPDIQIVFVPGKRGQNGRLIGWGHGFSTSAVLLRPESRGEIRLASPDPAARPVIDPRFFTDGRDLDVLVRGYREARRLMDSPQFDGLRGPELMPGREFDSDAALADWVRDTASTIFHPVGTCKMGPDTDPAAVVGPNLRVRGIDGLRVADASIMPAIVGGNTNAPVIMIAEKAADLVKAA